MLLIPILRDKLKALNPGVITTDERADIVITRLRGLRDNQEWIRWLRGEKTMQFAQNEPYHNIYLIDFDHPDKNDFLATNQLWIQGIERRRPDILLFYQRHSDRGHRSQDGRAGTHRLGGRGETDGSL